MAKDTFYFSHDYNARNDIKIKRLLAAHGMIGYGIYWALVEELYNNANALPLDYGLYAQEFRCPAEVIESVIKAFELFVIDRKSFSSDSVKKRLDERNEKSKKAKESAAARWNSSNNTNAMRTQCEGNAIKERKGNKRKGNSKREFTPPTLQQVKDYFKDSGYQEEIAVKAFEYYHSSDWKDKEGKQVLNWKQKMIGVWFRPEAKIKSESEQMVY